jgi:hypothetical protein
VHPDKLLFNLARHKNQHRLTSLLQASCLASPTIPQERDAEGLAQSEAIAVPVYGGSDLRDVMCGYS